MLTRHLRFGDKGEGFRNDYHPESEGVTKKEENWGDRQKAGEEENCYID